MKNDEWLAIGGVKGYMDGSLGSATALFFEPYADDPRQPRRLRGRGDPALDARGARRRPPTRPGCRSRSTRSATGPTRRSSTSSSASRRRTAPKDRRFRIEHAQHLRAADIPRFAELGVIASMQPYHADRRRPLGREADRAASAAGRPTPSVAARREGATLAFGSDWDVAPLSPLAGHRRRRRLAARSTESNPEGWVPEQKIAVEEALRAYTSSAAYAGVRGEGEGDARAPGSSRTSSSSRATRSRSRTGANRRRSRSTRRSSAGGSSTPQSAAEPRASGLAGINSGSTCRRSTASRARSSTGSPRARSSSGRRRSSRSWSRTRSTRARRASSRARRRGHRSGSWSATTAAGCPPEDARLALERHATSKISSDADLAGDSRATVSAVRRSPRSLRSRS